MPHTDDSSRPTDAPTDAFPMPRRELVAAAELASALHELSGADARDLVVEIAAPLAPRLRAFLRERARHSGGWLNRGWALPAEQMADLARVAAECGPQPARVFRHGAAPDDGGPARLWITDDERREPPERRSGA